MPTLIFALFFFISLSLSVAKINLPLPSDTLEIARWIQEPVFLTVTNTTSIYTDRKLASGRLGKINQGAQVQLLAYRPETYYVQGKSARRMKLKGWVSPKNLSPLSTNVLQLASERKALRHLIEEAIKNRDVVLGMTFDDVFESLGKPKSKSRTKSAKVDHEVWTYVKYERVPQIENYRGRDGFIYTRTTYIKVPVGQLSVQFNNGIVSAFHEDAFSN